MAVCHTRGLCHCGRFIQQRRIGDRHAGEFADKRLEIEQHLQPALADFRLVGRIGRVPGRVFEHVALDDCRYAAPEITLADERAGFNILLDLLTQFRKRIMLVRGLGKLERALEPDGLRKGLTDQCFHRRNADRSQHCADIRRPRAVVPGDKRSNLRVIGGCRFLGMCCHDFLR